MRQRWIKKGQEEELGRGNTRWDGERLEDKENGTWRRQIHQEEIKEQWEVKTERLNEEMEKEVRTGKTKKETQGVYIYNGVTQLEYTKDGIGSRSRTIRDQKWRKGKINQEDVWQGQIYINQKDEQRYKNK